MKKADYYLKGIDGDLYLEAKHLAVDRNMSMRALLITALKEYIFTAKKTKRGR